MNLLDLTPVQLKRAASIKERIAALSQELYRLLGASSNGPMGKNHRATSAAAKGKIAAAQKARWAKVRNAKSARPSTKVSKKDHERRSEGQSFGKDEGLLGGKESS